MSYKVTEMSTLNVVKKVVLDSYTNIIIPVDKGHLQKITKGTLSFSFLDKDLHKRIIDEVKMEKYDGECGKALCVNSVASGKKICITLYGIGENECKTSSDKIKFLAKIEECGAKMFLSHLKENVLIVGDYINTPNEYSHSKMISALALGFMQASYRFDRYMTTEKNKGKKHKVKSLSLFVTDSKNIDKEVNNVKLLLNSIYFVRDMVNEPANVIYPAKYAEIIDEYFEKSTNVKVKIFNIKDLEKIGMNMLLGVGMGSAKDSRVVIIEYTGNKEKDKYDVAFAGKGVTFDTGGISLKPAKGMEDMKGDMAGSAAVVGTLKLLSDRKAKINAIGIVGLVENMPSGSAQRPGDIVKSLSGQTVEVINTDAEGRLVLGDILYYAQTKYKPTHMIDVATLTGAIVVALGAYYAGMYSNSDELADMLNIASKKTGECIWRMPLDERFNKMNDSSFADMRNVTDTGQAGSITAAEFLKRFIADNKSWAHVDIAGVSDVGMESSIAQRGHSTAFGVKLFNQFCIDNIEKE